MEGEKAAGNLMFVLLCRKRDRPAPWEEHTSLFVAFIVGDVEINIDQGIRVVFEEVDIYITSN